MNDQHHRPATTMTVEPQECVLQLVRLRCFLRPNLQGGNVLLGRLCVHTPEFLFFFLGGGASWGVAALKQMFIGQYRVGIPGVGLVWVESMPPTHIACSGCRLIFCIANLKVYSTLYKEGHPYHANCTEGTYQFGVLKLLLITRRGRSL